MDFVSALLSFLKELLSAVAVTLFAIITSFTPPPTTPITIAPPAQERTSEAPPPRGVNTPATLIADAAPEALPPIEDGPLLDVNGLARSAVVNILCTSSTRTLRSASGSGIMIDPRGIVLTNAHLAQFLLLKDYPKKNSLSCVVRTGSPAKPTYYATLLYLPPAWITANASQIAAEEAMGTGEHDYAFLLITQTYGDGALPALFPSISYTVEEPDSGDPMLLAAYPSASLNNRAIVNNLLVSSTFTIVKKLYSFTPPRTVDLFSIGSTTISQGGASGGAAVRASDGKVMGIITVASDAKVIEDRDLRAITLAHVNRSLELHGTGSINELLSGDLVAKAAQFNKNTAPGLRQALIDALND